MESPHRCRLQTKHRIDKCDASKVGCRGRGIETQNPSTHLWLRSGSLLMTKTGLGSRSPTLATKTKAARGPPHGRRPVHGDPGEGGAPKVGLMMTAYSLNQTLHSGPKSAL